MPRVTKSLQVDRLAFGYEFLLSLGLREGRGDFVKAFCNPGRLRIEQNEILIASLVVLIPFHQVVCEIPTQDMRVRAERNRFG